MSDTRAGQPSERTPDFIPGWFIPRPGNADTAEREAVRFIGTQDFPINFLRPGESVRPARQGLGVNIDRDGETMSLAVPPGYWIVRDSDGRLHNWREEDFAEKWVRNNGRDWTAPVERGGDESLKSSEEPLSPAEIVAGSAPPEERPAWAGEPPAEGTRRRLILDTITRHLGAKDPRHDSIAAEARLALADAIELALCEVEGATTDTTPEAAALGTDVDRLNSIAEERWQRIGELEDQLEEVRESLDRVDAPAGPSFAKRIDRLFRELTGRAPGYGAAAGGVPAGTRELHVILEPINGKPGVSPDYRFVEIEDQDGRSVEFPWRVHPTKGDGFFRVVIPYGRDDAWVSEVAYQAAGAATRPLLEDHPDYVFPSERVSDAVAELLSDFGIPRACRDCATEQLEHGAKEVGDRRDATIKGLKAEVDRLLEGRESARAGEDHFKAQRDSALHLVRWLIGDIIPPDLIRFGDDEEARS